MKKTAQGFTLVELLVVIAIIAILAAVVVLVVNPLELTKKGRDSTRLADLSNLQQVINVAVQEASGSNILCNGTAGTCTGRSDTGTRAVDGTGWVKVNVAAAPKSVTLPILPVDPVNDATYHYTYGEDNAGSGYEIDAALESAAYADKAKNDGGSDAAVYEVGTDLNAI